MHDMTKGSDSLPPLVSFVLSCAVYCNVRGKEFCSTFTPCFHTLICVVVGALFGSVVQVGAFNGAENFVECGRVGRAFGVDRYDRYYMSCRHARAVDIFIFSFFFWSVETPRPGAGGVGGGAFRWWAFFVIRRLSVVTNLVLLVFWMLFRCQPFVTPIRSLCSVAVYQLALPCVCTVSRAEFLLLHTPWVLYVSSCSEGVVLYVACTAFLCRPFLPFLGEHNCCCCTLI